MKKDEQFNLYQRLVDNPDLSVEDIIKEYNDEWFLKMLLKDEDINILKNTDKETINKELDKLVISDNIKSLMKQIFKKD